MGRLRRHERSQLREHHDQRVLAEEGGFAGHVRPGHHQDAGAGVLVLCPEPAIIAYKVGAVAARQILLHHGVAAFDHGKDRALIHLRPRIVLLDRKLGEARMVVELGEARARRGKRGLLGKHALGELGEDVELERERAVGGGGDARFELAKLERGEAHDVGERLPVHEHLDMRRLGERAGIGGSDLDEIAEHVVVAHLQRFDAGRLGVTRLQPGDHLAAAVPELAMLIEIAIEAIADEAAVALVQRQLVGERGGQGSALRPQAPI